MLFLTFAFVLSLLARASAMPCSAYGGTGACVSWSECGRGEWAGHTHYRSSRTVRGCESEPASVW